MSSKSILRDVARTAGVSLRTASRVLNNDPNVAAATRDRVQTVMRDLRYTPDLVARSLRAGKDATIGLVVESVADPFFSEVVAAIELAASESLNSVFIASTLGDPARERDLIGQLFQRRVSGLLLTPTASDHGWLQGATGTTPVVLIDRPAPGLDADLVAIDDHAATAAAVEHLLASGHRRIAYVGDYPNVLTSRERLAGFRETMAAHGIPVPPELVRADCPNPRAAAEATRALLSEQAPTAFISAATRCSLGVVPALHAGHRTDVALVGFGDFAMADTLQPGITVIDHPAEAIGRAAVERLVARLADPSLPVTTTRIPVALIKRGSGELPA
ncbi:MAG TPA: LacI family DNA-binding transcriptional regulator [Kineosporiaceae bacterium]|nr:LacI family DNA-binding transcriptional regulator [Kineosporiaceae bacterium]